MAKDLRLSVETAQDLSFLLGQTEHLKEVYDQGRGRVEEL
jgi:3-hydroxyisobutyrate dehydrogenase-like beta-hydroxyacid dehydrogenase